MDQRDYWDKFYSHNPIFPPSNFAKWVSEQPDFANGHLVDWGCGSGRDGIFLASCMKRVTLVDNSESAIQQVGQRIEREQLTNAEVLKSGIGVRLSKVNGSDEVIIHYARFFLHAIDDDELTRFIKNISELATAQTSFSLFEYRVRDFEDNLEYTFGNHRRWLRNKEDVSEAMSFYGWELKEEHQSRDFAVFQEEKPLVARQVFTRS